MDAGSCIVDQDVDPTELGDGRVAYALDVDPRGDFGEADQRTTAESGHLLRNGCRGIRVSADDDDVGTRFGERQCENAAETASRSGDYGHSTGDVEFFLHDRLLCPGAGRRPRVLMLGHSVASNRRVSCCVMGRPGRREVSPGRGVIPIADRSLVEPGESTGHFRAAQPQAGCRNRTWLDRRSPG